MEANDLTEYLASIIPDADIECAGCPAKGRVGAMVARDGKFYHSEECADRSCALYRKPQPERVDCNGWSI